MSRRSRVAVLAALMLVGGCITKGEYAADVKAWRSYYQATRPDLERTYGALPEPSRSNRLSLVLEEDETIKAAETRAGIAPDASQVTSGAR